MPVRERLRKVLGRSELDENGNKKPKLPKPVETPKPKYPPRFNQEHQEKLRAFSFSDAWNRRKSEHSEISPLHSRMHSRRSSKIEGRRSMGGHPSRLSEHAERKDIDGKSDDSPLPELSQSGTDAMTPELPLDGPTESKKAPVLDPDIYETEEESRVDSGGAHFDENELVLRLTKTGLTINEPEEPLVKVSSPT
ncbi:MAG: hypothetical protein M1824_001136 [Vezdaea acicularis]|nr:MAG: hypothetical protein M1824_001136 [Vezdaea acicularis]